MTSSQPDPSLPEGTTTQLPADVVQTLNDAISRENAAIWAYGLISAYDTENGTLVETVRAAHLARRDQASAIVSTGGGTPPAPAPAYDAPPVTDIPSAREFALLVEDDCAAAWYAVIGNTDIPELRWMPLAGLTDAATTATRFRRAEQAERVTDPFPGRP